MSGHAMPDDEEDDEVETTEASEVDPKKKKPKKKKKKKGKSQDAQDAQDDEAGEAHGLNYWPAPDNFMSMNDGNAGEDEEWVDITSLCELAVSGMNLGEMIESSNFRLLDAMSAIEIMDPKMDTGYKSHEDMTLAKAEALGLVSEHLEAQVLVGLMDHLMMYYLLWLDGHTIVQTCFSCVYLQDAPRLLKPIPTLGSFVDALLVACQHAKNAVNSAGVWDDEDFMPTMFNVDFQASSVFSSDPSKVNEKIKAEREKLQDESAACRLEFMSKYMSALVALAKPKSSTLPSTKGLLAKCAQLLKKIEETAQPPGEEVKKRFAASLNRKLLVPGPPRQVEPIEDPKVVFSMWEKHINELSHCCSFLMRPLGDLLQGVLKSEDKPNVLSRSVAQVVVSESGFVRRLLQESLEEHLFPAEAMQHCKKQTEPFLQRCESMFLHMLKLTHLNRARRFRRLAHVFPDFNELQLEAYRLDDTLRSTFGANLQYSRPSWIFIMDHALQAMITKLLIGFQLDIYEEAELHMIYWYVDYLSGLRIHYLNEMYCAKESSGGKKKVPRAKDILSGKGSRPKHPPPSLVMLEAMQSMVRGLFRLLAFCLSEGLLSSPKSVRAGLAQRFVLRFRCLETFQLPHLPSYHDFDQSAVLAQEASEKRSVLSAAQASFHEASQLLERFNGGLKDRDSEKASSDYDLPKALRRVAVANQLGITQLLRLETEELSRKKVITETLHHPDFISIQVVDK